MRIAAEIAQDMLGSAEWPLAVNDPLLSVRLPNQFGKHLRPSEWLQVAVKVQSAVPESFFESIGELSPEQFFQCRYGQREFRMRWNPPAMIRGQTSGRSDAMDMRMMLEF